VRRLVYHGIRGAMVFSTTTGDDAPIANVDGRRPPDRPLFFVRPSVTAVTFLPAFTAWFAVVMDWLSMTVVLPAFREPGGTLWSRLVLAEKLHVVLGSGIGAAFGLLAVMMCARIVAYRKATRAVMEQYRKRL